MAGVNLVNDREKSVEMSNHSQTDEWKWARRMETKTFYQRFNSKITKPLQIVEHC